MHCTEKYHHHSLQQQERNPLHLDNTKANGIDLSLDSACAHEREYDYNLFLWASENALIAHIRSIKICSGRKAY